MKRNIIVTKVKGTPIESQAVEIVERKGLGHPDYIADSIAESFSRNLSKYYIENFGRILHHNVDKLEVVGGETKPEFGGGKIIRPISILFSGRATTKVGEKLVPVEEIAVSSAKDWLKKNIRFIEPDTIDYFFETKNGAANLSNSFKSEKKVYSNDTSFGVGYAPLSESENLVLRIERLINSISFKKEFPFSGEDVKVMCVRKKDKIDITIAMAFIDKYVKSVSDYYEKKKTILNELEKDLASTKSGRKIKISLNNIDSRSFGKDGCYLTVTGSSSEHGDDGAVGRGNRVNGLITPNRPMSMEAAAGKNPVNHIGKIYNLLSLKIANKLYETIKVPLTVKMVGRIGAPLDQPIAASIETIDKLSKDQKQKIISIVDDELARITEITKEILENKFAVC
jgi:S-adenosylmethionine synthetase